jgi:cytochrome c peroxidase
MKLFVAVCTLITSIACASRIAGTFHSNTHSISFPLPPGWPSPLYDFNKNPLTQEGFELGRKLFYEKRLSSDGNFSCASCHQQQAAFSNAGQQRSRGFDNMLTTRNAPSLSNLAWQKEFGWDGSLSHLDLQSVAPFSKNEMGKHIQEVISFLQRDAEYPQMFAQAFGDSCITTDRVAKSFSQFLLMMVSSNSRYDKVMRGEANFNLVERMGFNIFIRKCGTCHKEPLFTDLTYRSVGLQADPFLWDPGRMTATGNKTDSMKFRVPGLRNAGVTFPYEHDGRFHSLLQVIKSYRNSAGKNNHTDSLLRKGIALTKYEINALSEFIKTLTDSSFLSDPRFFDPSEKKRSKNFEGKTTN